MSAAEDVIDGIIARAVAESAGTFDLDLIPPEDGLDLFEAAVHGSQEAIVLLDIVEQTMRRIHTEPPLCLCCPATVHRLEGVTFSHLRPSIENSTARCIGLVICAKCDVRSAGDPRLVEALRGIWPEVRLLKVRHPNGGRA